MDILNAVQSFYVDERLSDICMMRLLDTGYFVVPSCKAGLVSTEDCSTNAPYRFDSGDESEQLSPQRQARAQVPVIQKEVPACSDMRLAECPHSAAVDLLKFATDCFNKFYNHSRYQHPPRPEREEVMIDESVSEPELSVRSMSTLHDLVIHFLDDLWKAPRMQLAYIQANVCGLSSPSSLGGNLRVLLKKEEQLHADLTQQKFMRHDQELDEYDELCDDRHETSLVKEAMFCDGFAVDRASSRMFRRKATRMPPPFRTT